MTLQAVVRQIRVGSEPTSLLTRTWFSAKLGSSFQKAPVDLTQHPHISEGLPEPSQRPSTSQQFAALQRVPCDTPKQCTVWEPQP